MFVKESWPGWFWSQVCRSEGCWTWASSIKNDGYAQIRIDGKKRYVHRVAYELMRGEIPKGKFIDHLCRNRSCVNPEHLEIVTNKENILRGIAPSAQNAKKTHCPKGHIYDALNTRFYRGSRYCRTCRGWNGAFAQEQK